MGHWNRLSNILKKYELASGQKLNTSKTAIFFSLNTPQEAREKILEESGIPSSQRCDTYLGLPALVGKSRTKEFKGIIDRVWKRLQDWKFRLLSQAGREILLKAVIQAIPTYCMSVFMLPKTLCTKINLLMQQFWWGSSSIHWLRWSKLGVPKSKGGMGFRDFNCFNKALLAKQCWRLWRSPDSLVSQILKAKYYASNTILEAKIGTNPSYVWRSILGASDILKEGLFCRIGNGENTRIWGDKWVPIPTTYAIHSVPRGLDIEAKVMELMDRDRHAWDKAKLEQLFSAEEVKAILEIPINPQREDAVIWREGPNGLFTVKTAYHQAMRRVQQGQPESSTQAGKTEVWGRLWKLPIPNAEKIFLWRACHDILPTKERLYRRKVTKDALCPICLLRRRRVFTSCGAVPRQGMFGVGASKSSIRARLMAQHFVGWWRKCFNTAMKMNYNFLGA
jgi:hypothetical protein